MVPYSQNKKLTVIQFFSGAGVGKSTVAPDVFAKMKRQQYNVEFVPEHVKKWTRTAQVNDMFTEQDLVLGLQNNAYRSLVGKVDYAVTDTSLLLGAIYCSDWFPQSFIPFMIDVWNSYDNLNIFLARNPDIPFDQNGRNENYEQAKEKDDQLYQFLIENNINFYQVTSDNDAPDTILKIVGNYSRPYADDE